MFLISMIFAVGCESFTESPWPEIYVPEIKDVSVQTDRKERLQQQQKQQQQQQQQQPVEGDEEEEEEEVTQVYIDQCSGSGSAWIRN